MAAAADECGGGEACFSGWPVWEVTVDDVQQTVEKATCSERQRMTAKTSGIVGMDDGRAAVDDDGQAMVGVEAAGRHDQRKT